MRGPAVRPIVIAAGGTGGHFFPAAALAEALRTRGHRVVLMTDARAAAAHGAAMEHHVIRGAGIAGRGALRGALALAGLAAGVAQARGLLARLNPAVVTAFGGYPSVGPVIAARSLRRRPAVLLHEQNAVLGRANRALARFADVLALSFATTVAVPNGARTALVGNPVRPAITQLAPATYNPPDTTFRLLVIGGSLGARVFSDVVPAAMAALPDGLRARLHVTQQCRAEDLERVGAAYRAIGISATLAPFFSDIAELLAGAHLVIARAGASTVAELAVAGRPAVLVPLPHAIDDHQTANARALVQAGAAWSIPQPDFTHVALATMLERLADNPGLLAAAAAAGTKLARPAAAAALADLTESLAQRSEAPVP